MEQEYATIILAAGGTGGHIFPAESLAEELITRGLRPVLVTDKRFNNFHGAFKEMEIRTIRAGTMQPGILGKIGGLFNIAVGICQARGILRKLNPGAVVGFGGYPSFPTVFAATQRGIPSFIHEQNAVLGRANRLLAPRVDAIATTFVTTAYIKPDDSKKVERTGNPVRAAIRALHDVPYSEISPNGAVRLLVMGGSQGAAILSEVIPKAIGLLPEPLRRRLRIDQQCRAADIEEVQAKYKEIGMQPDLATFFTDVPARLAAAHLVISRAGSSTLSELTAAGRPAILVPLPTAMDDHQAINARALEVAGGGWVMKQEEFTAETLAAKLEALLTMPAMLAKAAAGARNAGRIHAARDLADLVCEKAGIDCNNRYSLPKPKEQVA